MDIGENFVPLRSFIERRKFYLLDFMHNITFSFWHRWAAPLLHAIIWMFSLVWALKDYGVYISKRGNLVVDVFAPIFLAFAIDFLITLIDIRFWYTDRPFKSSVVMTFVLFMANVILISFFCIRSASTSTVPFCKVVLLFFLGALMKWHESWLNANIDKYLAEPNDEVEAREICGQKKN